MKNLKRVLVGLVLVISSIGFTGCEQDDSDDICECHWEGTTPRFDTVGDVDNPGSGGVIGGQSFTEDSSMTNCSLDGLVDGGKTLVCE